MLGVNLDLDDDGKEVKDKHERNAADPPEEATESGSRRAQRFTKEKSEPGETANLKRPTQKHMKSNVTSRESIVCRVCAIPISRKSLVSHMKLNHQDGMAVMPEISLSPLDHGVAGVKMEMVEEQANIHTPSRSRLNCNFCTKTFKEQRALRRHERKKHAELAGDISCTVCFKFFSRRAFISHMKSTHPKMDFNLPNLPKKETMFSCEFCAKIFTAKRILRKHKNNKHPELASKGDVACEICFKYIKKSFMKTHLQAKHANEIK